MTVNFKGNVWELQLSNAVFCYFLFSIDVNLTVYIPTATLVGHFDCSFLALHLLMSWPSTTTKSGIKNTRDQGLNIKGHYQQ